jgi:hypothetical protein
MSTVTVSTHDSPRAARCGAESSLCLQENRLQENRSKGRRLQGSRSMCGSSSAMRFYSSEASKVSFVQGADIPAGQPYLLKNPNSDRIKLLLLSEKRR